MSPFKSPSRNRLFVSAPSSGVKMTLLMILSIALMTFDRQANRLDQVRSGLSLLVYPVRAAVDLPWSAWHWFSESLASRGELLATNRELNHRILLLNGRLQKFDAMVSENERLRSLLASSRDMTAELQIAELVRADLDPFRHRVTINRGDDAGVRVGNALLDASGVVGQVVLTNAISANAILITDPGHATPVEINRNGVRTIALGTGALDRLDLPFLPNNAEIRPGDLLVTSGLAGRFPRGYPVAVIDEIIRDPGAAFARITARPVAQLDRLREVLVVSRNAEERAPDQLENGPQENSETPPAGEEP